MNQIGVSAAKKHFDELLARVQRGERVVISRRGQPIAELRPVFRHDAARARRPVTRLRKLRRELAARGVRIRDILRENESLRGLTHAGHEPNLGVRAES
jgi:prevent-host-death family protein